MQVMMERRDAHARNCRKFAETNGLSVVTLFSHGLPTPGLMFRGLIRQFANRFCPPRSRLTEAWLIWVATQIPFPILMTIRPLFSCAEARRRACRIGLSSNGTTESMGGRTPSAAARAT
jgi:hypothetical protein